MEQFRHHHKHQINLIIGTVHSPIGQEIQVPIQLENTDEIVALQFDIVGQEKIVILNEVVSTNRWDDHVGVVKQLGNGHSRVLVYSPLNKPFKGNSGNILSLKARVSESCSEGEEYPANFGDIVLTKKNGDNCVTASQNGKFIILKSPDLTPLWDSVNKTSLNPSDTIQCSWRVRNIGGLPTAGGWKEQVFAVSEDNRHQVLLGTQHCENIIPSGGEVVRSMKIALPEIPGIDGECSLMVKIIPYANCGEPASMTGNNSCQSNQSINIAKRLYLTDVKSAVEESNPTPLKYKITRSGSTSQNETFTVNVLNPDSRVTLPAMVEIPQNQSSAYFYISFTANGKLDESDRVEFSIDGNQYPKITSILSIIDDTFPQLNVVLSKEEVTEGESFSLNIELPKSFAESRTLFLSSDNSAKIKVPAEVIVPAGQTTVSVPLSVVNNEDAELETIVTLRITADDLESAECEVIILDDDMPMLELSFSPSEVSENAGVSAVIATVRRLTNVDKNVKLLFFDDSKGAIELSHKTLSMGKGAENAQFIIDIKDNDIVDGDKHFNVTAAVYSSACDCYASELSGGLVSQTLTVLDDDGPHLSIVSASQAFLEGASDNVITITRNTNPDSDITVTISSDKDDLLEYNHSVVIPSGAMSVDVKVSVLSNEASGDGDIVSFKVESADMAAGSCWVVLTDQTLPDATIQLEVAQDSPSAGESVDLILTISNIGNAPLQRNTPIDIECTGVKGAKRVYTKKAIEKGDNDRLVVEDFQLPERTGLVTLSAVINDNESMTELLYSNNRAKSIELTLSPAFDVTASVDKNIYKQEENVIISGHASGEAGKNAKIEIHLSNNEARQVLNATTDDNGNYEYTYKLLPRQTGHFSVSACYPTSSPTDEVATFDVYGLQLDKAFITCEPGLGETFNGTFRLSNPGNLSQNSLKIEKISVPANCEFAFDAPSKIDAGETADINFSLKGTGLSSGKEFEKIPLSITTAEGTKTIFIIYYYIQSLHGKLYTSIPSISTTMLKDTPRDYPLVIRNIGKGETGKITFALPSWVETATPREMASLAAGDSTTVMLRFKPMDEMKLNVATKGKLGVNCSNGDGISVSFDIMPVSEAVGKLKVDVVDEFTFYTEEAPHVSNAQIKITHPTSKEVIVEGRTDNDGIFTAEMNEGWYIMTVEADNHDIYTENIIISPGTELNKEVFMPYQAITYNWNVEETEIEDEYVFETTVDFDTRVPKPVIVISLPDEKPEPYSVIPVKITNKGLINAVNIEMSLEVSEGYKLEFLNDPTAEVLAPQQTLVFYAKLIPTESSSEIRAKAPRANRECIWIISKAKYQELCQKYTGDQFVRMLKKYGKKSCFSSGSGNGGSGGHGGGNGGSGGGVGRPGCWGGSSYDSDYYVIDWSNPEKYCDRKPGDNPKDGDDDNPSDLSGDEMPPVPEGEPEENDDCDEEPNICFFVKAVNGNQRYGLAADGKSQLQIVLDVSKSKLPKSECGDLVNTEWSITTDEGGTLEYGDSWKEVTYTAPSEYNENWGAAKEVSLSFKYTYNGKNYDETTTFALVRVPVAFVHGLNSSPSNWNEMIRHICAADKYSLAFIYSVDYERWHNDAFNENYPRVRAQIESFIDKVKKRVGYEVSCVDVVGHSMGGLLTKKVIQKYGSDNIRKLITINTPHGGSQLGNLLMDERVMHIRDARYRDNVLNSHNIFAVNQAYGMFAPSHGRFEDGAVANLSVNMPAINEINDNSTSGVKCHAIVTNSRNKSSFIEEKAFNLLFGALQYNDRQAGFADLFDNDESDFIVPVQSQMGGLHSPNISYMTYAGSVDDDDNGLFAHTSTCANPVIQERVLRVLTASPSSSVFSDGFGMVANLNYDMDIDEVLRIYRAPAAESSRQMISETQSNVKFNYEIVDNTLNINVSPDDINNAKICVGTDDEILAVIDGQDVSVPLPNATEGELTILVEGTDSNGEGVVEYTTIPFNTIGTTEIEKIELDPLEIFGNETISPKLRVVWSNGIITYPKDFDYSIEDTSVAKTENYEIFGLRRGKTEIIAKYKDLECKGALNVLKNSVEDTDGGDNSDAICSTVTLSFKQSAVMTRQAFRGIFSLNNGHQTATLRDFKLNLEVKDEDGVVATKREFEITPEKLAGFQGSLDFNSGWSLEPSHNGEASILFIPTKFAAPTEPKEYSFGGTFSYIDPYTGLTVTRTLNPVTLTVNPSPQLELTYFMQRDVFGDDPLTEEIEPMKPAEFALLLNNIGAGDATSLKLSTGQPQIVSNEKGLYINFELISSQLNGGEYSMMLGGNSVTDFGSLKAGEQSYAQWWLQSSLLGHFVKYDVKSTHVTSYDNPDLSLVDTVTIHELIHGFDLNSNDIKRRAFLVNDITDVNDTPDQLYFTDGTQADVAIARDAFITKDGDLEYILNVSASASGWNYGTISDPTNGRQNLSSIIRLSDGAELAIDNFWQTDRTLRDGKDPLAENLLHFIDNFSNGDASYRLIFTSKPDIGLAVDSIIGLPTEEDFLNEQLKTVTIRFNKPIDSSTFTIEDLSLSCQGERIDISTITITPMTDTEYLIDLSSATLDNGYYVLTVQTTGIIDAEGFNGESGKNVSWIQFIDGKVALKLTTSPAEGGTISPNSGHFDYDSYVTVKATPAEGYDFVAWMLGDTQISTEHEYTHHLTDDTELKALFAIKHYNVTIDYDPAMGLVEGASSGIYEYGTQLQLTAIPADKYKFDAWQIDGERGSDIGHYTIIVNGDVTIEALFKELSTSIESVGYDALRVRITPLPLRDMMNISGNFNEIRMVNIYDARGVRCMAAQNVKADQSINVGKLSAGIYYIQIITDKGVYSAKVLKR